MYDAKQWQVLKSIKKTLQKKKIFSVQSSWNEFTILYISVANAIMELFNGHGPVITEIGC